MLNFKEENMRGNIANLLVVVAMVALLSAPAFAKGPKGPALGGLAPTDLNCTLDAGTGDITCTWTAIDDPSVKKYAIEIVAGYDLDDLTCEANAWYSWDYTVPAGTTEFIFNPEDLEYCPDPDPCFLPVSIEMVKVKGLTVPTHGGPSGSQNNMFAIYDTPFDLCPAD
jgi:hypothetical protein